MTGKRAPRSVPSAYLLFQLLFNELLHSLVFHRDQGPMSLLPATVFVALSQQVPAQTDRHLLFRPRVRFFTLRRGLLQVLEAFGRRFHVRLPFVAHCRIKCELGLSGSLFRLLGKVCTAQR